MTGETEETVNERREKWEILMRVIGSDRIGVQSRSEENGLYKEDKHHPANVYDDDVKDESHVDDRVANEDNEKLLSGAEITVGIQEFLEMGMRYKVNIESKEGKYTQEN